ncbi:MAG: hypothetical protein BAA04_07035 [Firmicutes bacterium ZCTH02-B6]|nr:MAG: hypothetical protein BAA04_07035 [Firmicutes bacterium ZCTH02-B6]
MELAQLHAHIQALQSRYDRESGALEQLQRSLRQAESQLEALRERLQVLEAVQLLFAKTSELARARVKVHVEQVVTAALQAVFGRDMRFEIVLNDQAGQTAASWRVVDTMEGGETVSGDPEDARGGGISDVVSLALRLALLELVRPRLGGPILLDEPGKHVSAEHRQALGEFLRAYAQRTGRQIIMVTHHEELAAVADVAYRVERRNGVSEVTRL